MAQIIEPSSYSLSLLEWHQRYEQQATWTQAVREYLFSKVNLEKGDQLLEVGSGTGAVLSRVAERFPVNIWGIDIALPSLIFSKNLSPDFNLVQANGYNLPFPDGSFSLTFCHFLLLWLQRPADILKEMIRVTRPGGAVIALAEPDHQSRIDYPPPLDQLGQLQTEALKQQGVDVGIGRKLEELFEKNGLMKIEIGVLGAQWTSKHSEIDETEWMVLRSDLAGQLSESELNKYQKIDQQARQKGTRVLFIPTFYAIGFMM